MQLKESVDTSGPKYWQPAALSLLAYCDNPDQPSDRPNKELNIQAFVARMFPRYRVVWSSTLTANDNYGFIVVSPANEYFLTFRGTLPFSDGSANAFLNWAEDLNVLSQQDWSAHSVSGALISAGAYQAFTEMNEATNVLPVNTLTAYEILVQQAVVNNYPVYIGGHSLGGNLADTYASFFAAQLVADQHVSSTCVANHYLCTFAAPAPGNQAFAEDLANKFPTTAPYQGFHYEWDTDIVPRFPMRNGLCNVISNWYPTDPSSSITYPYAPSIYIGSETLADFLIKLGKTIYNTVTIGGRLRNRAYVQSQSISVPGWLNSYQDNTLQAWVSEAASQHAAGNYLLMFWWISPPEVSELATHLTKASFMLPSAQAMERNSNLPAPTLP